jgi:putative sterol carrier protein
MMNRDEIAQIFPEMANRFDTQKAGNLTANIQFELSGDNGGQYWLRIADGKCEAGAGLVDNPKMTIRASADDWAAIALRQLDPIQAVIKGKMKVQGDTGLALKLQSIFADQG